MAVTGRWFARGLDHILSGDVALATGSLSLILLDNTYSPNIENDEFYDPGGSGIGQDEVTGTGYTAGGQNLASVAVTVVDDSAAPAHATSTAYLVGDIVRPASANGHIYRCIVAGTSGGSAPTWPTNPGEDVTDGSVTWEEMGSSFVRFDADNVSWTPSTTITARYAAVIDDGTTPGTDDYVLVLIDFGQDESSSNGDFNVNFHATVGIAALAVEL